MAPKKGKGKATTPQKKVTAKKVVVSKKKTPKKAVAKPGSAKKKGRNSTLVSLCQQGLLSHNQFL